MLDLNEELPIDIQSKWLAFGCYSWDGSTIYYDLTTDNKVFVCERDSTKKLKVWDSLYSWLTEEISRLSNMFDEKGVEKDEDAPTTPF